MKSEEVTEFLTQFSEIEVTKYPIEYRLSAQTPAAEFRTDAPAAQTSGSLAVLRGRAAKHPSCERAFVLASLRDEPDEDGLDGSHGSVQYSLLSGVTCVRH